MADPEQLDFIRGKMAELNLPIYNFRHGVLTPKLIGRPNLDLYKSGVLVGENFITQLHGPTQYRGGFIHVRTTRRNNVAHFIPFTFSDDEAYMLSFTDGYLRFFTDGVNDTGGVLSETALSISGITQANPGVLTVVGNTFVDGDEVFIDNCVGMEDLNGQYYLVSSSPATGSSERNWTFSNGANYDYNASLVEVTGGNAQLVNVPPYSIADPTIETKTGFPFSVALDDFIETATKPANTEIKYILSVNDGVDYQYWDGAAWSASNGTYAQSNTAATINTNISTLSSNGTLKIKAFLHTSDNTKTPQLDNVFTSFTAPVSTTFTLTDQDGNAIDTTSFDAYVGSGTVARVYEIESPYAEADLRQLKFAGKGDIMYIDHPDYIPRKLTRLSDGSFTLLPYTRTDDPFAQAEISNISNANPGQVTTTAAHGFETGDEILIEDVLGMTEVNGTIYTITKVDNENFTIGVDTTSYTAYDSSGACMLDGNQPAAPGFYGGRLFHGGSRNDPDILFGSMAPDTTTGEPRYEEYTLGANADDGILFPLTSASTGSIDRIRFFIGTRQFLGVGTYAGMLKVNGGSDATPLSATAIQSYPVDSYGVADIMPLNFGTDILYVQRGGGVLYSFKYTLLSDGFKSVDETVQSDEIAANGIAQLAYQQGLPSTVWAAMEDGRLLSLVYSDSEEASAWNEQLVGGTGTVLTVGAQPQNDNKDRVWIAVEREINGVTRRYVEYLAKNSRIPERTDFYSGPDNSDKEYDDMIYYNKLFYAQKRQNHLDSSLTLDTTEESISITPGAVSGDDVTFGASASIFSPTDLKRKIQVKYNEGDEQGIAIITEYVSETLVKCKILQDFANVNTITGGNWYFTQDTVSGLTHLEGETVSVVADGGIHADCVVSDGAITLDNQVTYAIIGLSYYGRIQTMPLELLLFTGITPGKFKSVNKVNLLFRNSLGVSYGTDPYNMQRISFRDGPQYTDRPAFLFNGVKEQSGFDNYDEQRTMWVVQTVPYPCTLVNMVLDMEFSEEN